MLPNSTANNCTQTWLENLVSEADNVASTVQYTRRCVRARKKGGRSRPSIARVDDELLRGTQTIDLNVCRRIPEPPCVPLELDVHPAPPLEDASHMIFGASTTISRLWDSMPQFARWMGRNGALLVVLVSESDAASCRQAEDEMHKLGMNATVVPVDEALAPAQRHMTITEEIYKRRRAGKTEWHVIIDDDTFFPYMPETVAHMRANYDYRQPLYIGALSEDERAIKHFGIQAYGGGGIFLSAALADQVHAAFDVCIKEQPGWGDLMIRDCIFHNTRTKLTVDSNFHQLDLKDDVSGFYELGHRPFSIHHYKSWSHLPLERMHLVADYCGDCFLQRWQFADNFILTNGFSAVRYPQGIHFDPDLMEATMRDPGPYYEWSLNLRPKLPPEAKLSYRLLDSTTLPNGSIRQLYYQPGKLNDAGQKRTNDEVIEILWGEEFRQVLGT